SARAAPLERPTTLHIANMHEKTTKRHPRRPQLPVPRDLLRFVACRLGASSHETIGLVLPMPSASRVATRLGRQG
ncbi:MAG TPA: hypothetical protein VMW31_02250, partial [Devosiaceae bacterium]|nr:hypothetical protein [Devosiaceae bacterium]